MTMTSSSQPGAGNPSRDPSQPVPYQPVTRPTRPIPRDGLPRPMTSGNPVGDGGTGSRRTRPDVPKPAAKPPHLTPQPNPSHSITTQTTATPTHRSEHHAAPTRTDTDQPPTDRTGDTPDRVDTADSADSPKGDRIPRPRPGAPVPGARTAPGRTPRQSRSSRVGLAQSAATATGDTGPAGPAVFSPHRLRAWRHVTATSHTALAQTANVTAEHVQACERGTACPSGDTIRAWSAVLGCQADQLMSTTPEDQAEYWRAASQAMPPISSEDLAVVADVLRRSHARDPA
jgi:DNA-binding transcriptional regulator YiaG